MRGSLQKDVPTIEILDLLHVTPRLWDASALFYSRGSRAAESFVKDRLLRILRGEIDSVIRGLRRMATIRNVRGKELGKLQKIYRDKLDALPWCVAA